MPTRVAAVQLPFVYFNTPQEFADHIRPWIEQAARNGAQLILLPHLTSFMLFGMFELDAKPSDSLEHPAQRQGISVPEWLNDRAGYVFDFYLHLFQSLAARVEVWLAPGTALEVENDALYLTAFLLNPAGEIVGRQRQMHLTAREIAWGISKGDTLQVFNTEVGDFGFVVGGDVHDPGVARALALNGANVLLHPAAYTVCDDAPGPSPTRTSPGNQADKSPDQDTQELAQEAQANHTFAVQANLVGGKFRGRSAIYAPVEMTNDKSGILAQAANDSDAEIIVADLELVRT